MMSEQEEVMPGNMTLDYYDDYMHIQKKWAGLGAIVLTVFLVVWLFFARFILSMFGSVLEGVDSIIVYAMPFGLLMVTGFLSYICLARWVNKTDIFVSKELMEVKIHPLPWRGNMRRKTTDIEQFYIEKRMTETKDSTTVFYDVMFKVKAGEHIQLIAGFSTYERAHFIEQKIEQYLGIKDVKVDGENE